MLASSAEAPKPGWCGTIRRCRPASGSRLSNPVTVPAPCRKTSGSPSPALKTYISRRPWAADEYLLWSVAEGGAAFGSSMPAFREQLTRQQIWQIIAYMRAGFPRGTSDR